MPRGRGAARGINANPSLRGGRGGRGRGHSNSETGEQNQSLNFVDNDLCAFCSTVAGDDAVGCDRCLKWYHPSQQCTGLSLEALNVIASDGGGAIAFICCNCRLTRNGSPNSQANQSNQVSPEAMTQLYEMVKSLAVTVNAMSNQVATLTTSLQSHNSSTDRTARNLDDETLFTKFYEFEERKKRKTSIVVKGLNALNNAEFTDKFGDVAEAITGERVIPCNVYCINAERHIYRATITNRDIRINILSGAKNLKDHEHYSGVYINKDLTFQQREEARERRTSARSNHPQAAESQAPQHNSNINLSRTHNPPIQQVRSTSRAITRTRLNFQLGDDGPSSANRGRGRGFQ